MLWAAGRPASPLCHCRGHLQTANQVAPVVLNAERITLDDLKLDGRARCGVAGRVLTWATARLDHQRVREPGRALFIASRTQARPRTQWFLLTVLTRGNSASRQAVLLCPRCSMQPPPNRGRDEPAAVLAHDRGPPLAAGPAAAPGQPIPPVGTGHLANRGRAAAWRGCLQGLNGTLHTPPAIRGRL